MATKKKGKNKSAKKTTRKKSGRRPLPPQHGLPTSTPETSVTIPLVEGSTEPQAPVHSTPVQVCDVPGTPDDVVEIPVGGTVGLDQGEGGTEVEVPAAVEHEAGDEESEQVPPFEDYPF